MAVVFLRQLVLHTFFSLRNDLCMTFSFAFMQSVETGMRNSHFVTLFFMKYVYCKISNWMKQLI